MVAFMHKSKSTRNTILALRVGEGWIEWMTDIRQEVVKHFIEIFKELDVERPRLDDVVFRSLSDDDNCWGSSVKLLKSHID